MDTAARGGTMNMDRTPMHLLWTGGWDSTFQLMQLLLVHGEQVEPVYLIDPTRRSTDIELRTMDAIREAIVAQYPHVRGALRPTIYVRVDELAPDQDIENAWHRIRRTWPIGSQYAWLARFCKQRNLQNLELGAESTQHGASALLGEYNTETTARAGYTTYTLTPEARDGDVGVLFGACTFPLIRTTKLDMLGEAEARAWMPILRTTWFCHKPAGDRPCGICNPCQGVIDEGFGWRIPRDRRMYATLHRATVRPFTTAAKRLVMKVRGAYLTPRALG
jgi:7-cyano-7-deazaguanine synthase in queuosine biosynthesis